MQRPHLKRKRRKLSAPSLVRVGMVVAESNSDIMRKLFEDALGALGCVVVIVKNTPAEVLQGKA